MDGRKEEGQWRRRRVDPSILQKVKGEMSPTEKTLERDIQTPLDVLSTRWRPSGKARRPIWSLNRHRQWVVTSWRWRRCRVLWTMLTDLSNASESGKQPIEKRLERLWYIFPFSHLFWACRQFFCYLSKKVLYIVVSRNVRKERLMISMLKQSKQHLQTSCLPATIIGGFGDSPMRSAEWVNYEGFRD